MERGSFQGIAAGLERIVENTRFNLREAMDQFQEVCLMITPERNVPIDIVTETRQTYKKIQEQLTKISVAKQLLEGKYRQYYHRDYQREKRDHGNWIFGQEFVLQIRIQITGDRSKEQAKRQRKTFCGLPSAYPLSLVSI